MCLLGKLGSAPSVWGESWTLSGPYDRHGEGVLLCQKTQHRGRPTPCYRLCCRWCCTRRSSRSHLDHWGRRFDWIAFWWMRQFCRVCAIASCWVEGYVVQLRHSLDCNCSSTACQVSVRNFYGFKFRLLTRRDSHAHSFSHQNRPTFIITCTFKPLHDLHTKTKPDKKTRTWLETFQSCPQATTTN